MKKYFLPLFFFIGIVAAAKPVLDSTKFLRAKGTIIIDSTGERFALKGVAFTNWVNTNSEIPESHHDEIDFKRIKMIGFNSIRFYIDYHTLEDDDRPFKYKKEGWAWLDKNIAWAKKHGIYLLLNMHVPQGGYQSQGAGTELWESKKNQKRLAALWIAIADRYKNENIVAGYGIVNEPVPVKSLSQWQELAQNLTNAIRTVDNNHLFFTESILYVKDGEQPATFPYFPIIKDNNTCYEFHIYDPIDYTHQKFDWYNGGKDGGRYPDEEDLKMDDQQWLSASDNNPIMPVENTEWKYFEGIKYKITDTKIKIGKPVVAGDGVKKGAVYFDDIIVEEYDANDVATGKKIMVETNSKEGWGFWSKANDGMGKDDKKGRTDKACIKITGTSEDASFTMGTKLILMKQGFSYKISGYMKGENLPADARCRIRFDFYTSEKEVIYKGKKMLENRIQQYIDWSVKHNVPLYMGEFGAGFHCFQFEKGGLTWVSDMMDICKEKQLNFNYHAYHEDAFGLYLGFMTVLDVNDGNNELINMLNLKLKQF
jgi:endoglucanase